MDVGARRTIKIWKFEIPVPGTKLMRTVLGILLCIGGCLWFLPVLGAWMLPVGLIILSIDHHPIRRLRRRVEVWWGRRKKAKEARQDGSQLL